MTPFESLRQYGTIFISQQTIRQCIGYGDPIMRGAEFKGFDGIGHGLNLSVLFAFMPRDFKPILKDLLPRMNQVFINRKISDDLLNDISAWIENNLAKRISGPTLDTETTQRDRHAFSSNPAAAAADMLWSMMERGENSRTIDIEIIPDDNDGLDDDDEEFGIGEEIEVDLSMLDNLNCILIALAFDKDHEEFVSHMNEHDGIVLDMINCSLKQVSDYKRFKANCGTALADALTMLGARLMRARMKTTEGPCSQSEMAYGYRFSVEVLENALTIAKEFKLKMKER